MAVAVCGELVVVVIGKGKSGVFSGLVKIGKGLAGGGGMEECLVWKNGDWRNSNFAIVFIKRKM